MRVCVLAGLALFAITGAGHAASVTNNDGSSHTLVVTEDGMRTEVVIGAGETLNICGGGCFLTLPNGDRAALSGDETVTIVGGAAVTQ